MDTTGFLWPTSSSQSDVVGTVAWSGIDGILTENYDSQQSTTFASCMISWPPLAYTYRLIASFAGAMLGAVLPVGALLVGYAVGIKRGRAMGLVYDHQVLLACNGKTSRNLADTLTYWPGVAIVEWAAYGGPADDLGFADGNALTREEIVAAGLSLGLSARLDGPPPGPRPVTPQVDTMRLALYYTLAPERPRRATALLFT